MEQAKETKQTKESLQELLTTIGLPINLDDTYEGDDGLLYCAKCNSLRVTKDIVPMFEHHMPVACKCMREASQKAREQEEYNRKMSIINRLRSASLLGARYKNTNFENTDLSVGGDFAKAYKRCKKYCEVANKALVNGYGIYIYGASGTGKTHLTTCICNELIEQYKQCLFTNFFEISKLIKSTWKKSNIESESTIRRICDIDFLILDDLGTEILNKNGEDTWLQEQVFDIINKRYNNKKPTIFSSNHSLNELITDRGMMEKTVDRIMEMSTAIIEISGESYRAKNRRKDVEF